MMFLALICAVLVSFAASQVKYGSSTIAGGGRKYTNGISPLIANLYSPSDVDTDENGNLYIADSNNCQIRLINSINQTISGIAGLGPTNCGYSGDNGNAASAKLKYPYSVSVGAGSSPYIFIADLFNHIIRVVNPSTGVISIFAGTKTAGFAGDGGPAASAQLNFPYSIGVDRSISSSYAGTVYIADSRNNRVRAVDPTNKFISTFAGSGTFGSADGPNSLATEAQFQYPYGLCVDKRTGNVFITDSGNHRIRMVDVLTRKIKNVVGSGTMGFSGDNALAIDAQLKFPYGISISPNGNLVISDSMNNRIRYVSQPELVGTAMITTIAGNGKVGKTDSSSDATQATLNYAFGVHIDSNENIYIADLYNNLIRKLTIVS